MKLGVLPQQSQVGYTVGVIVEDYLSSIAALRNMMRNVHHDYARESSHGRTLAERSGLMDGLVRLPVGSQAASFPDWSMNWGTFRLSPNSSPCDLRFQAASRADHCNRQNPKMLLNRSMKTEHLGRFRPLIFCR